MVNGIVGQTIGSPGKSGPRPVYQTEHSLCHQSPAREVTMPTPKINPPSSERRVLHSCRKRWQAESPKQPSILIGDELVDAAFTGGYPEMISTKRSTTAPSVGSRLRQRNRAARRARYRRAKEDGPDAAPT